MKWLETSDPEKIKKGKYKSKNWKQEEIDGFRQEYGPTILLNKINKLRNKAIKAFEAIRLSKPSTSLSSLFCKFSYGDIESK
ncbi:hypothetical protein AHAS_Ahas13G0263600 [Arachis hypogaea]